jgi:hypothetical protein
MRMAKANEADIAMAAELCSALDSLTQRWGATVPEAVERVAVQGDSEYFDAQSSEQCVRVLNYLIELANRASLERVVYGCTVMLDPTNMCVDPNANHIEHHPHTIAGHAARQARPLSEWHEDKGNVLWWKFPIEEPPYCGSPLDTDWPGYHTHWTPLIIPFAPAVQSAGEVPA